MMENTEAKLNALDSGFRILNIVLMECDFKRQHHVTFDEGKVIPNIHIEVSVNVIQDQVLVTERLIYSQELDNIKEVYCSVLMSATFQKVGESAIDDLEKFGKVNGAAILYPYMREHLSGMLMKAGLGVVYLPPANFTKA
jgi:preprotein translocase subunit SecB